MVATIKPPFTEIIVIIDYIWTQFDFRADIVASRIGKKNALNVLYCARFTATIRLTASDIIFFFKAQHSD